MMTKVYTVGCTRKKVVIEIKGKILNQNLEINTSLSTNFLIYKGKIKQYEYFKLHLKILK